MRRFWMILPCAAALSLQAADGGLLEAIQRGDSARALVLLEQKADVNAAGPGGSTALHWAAEQDDAALAAELLRRGARVDATNLHGTTPLFLACQNGSAPMVAMLLKAGAAAESATREGETALMTASRTGSREAVKLLLAKGAGVNRKESWRGQTALMWAAAEGHTAIVELLIEFGAEWRARSNGGYTPLLFAAREGKTEVVRALLKAGADPNDALPARTKRPPGSSTTEASTIQAGSTALHVAVGNAHYELAAMLLDAGADPNAAGPGWTVLHTISWVRKPGTGSNDPAPAGSGTMDSLALVRKLATKGAELNARMTVKSNAGLSALNTIGATPFLMAARCADAEYMRVLAELGADPKMPNMNGSTPLMVAAGVGTRSPNEDAGTEAEVLEAVEVALQLGNDINAVDGNGDTAMHGPAYKHLPAVVHLLAKRGARIEVWNRENKQGWTPLRIADGVNRTGNLRLSPPTAEALRAVMKAAGVSTELAPVAPSAVR